MSDASKQLAGILFVLIPTIEFGGWSLLRMIARRIPGYLDNPVRQNLFRAGHAHAGVLVLLALLIQPYADATAQDGFVGWLSRSGVAVAALVMPGGFFFSSMGAGRTAPNRLIVMVFAGAALLAISLTSLAIGLLTA